MTTFKGAMRSYGATVRKIERSQQRYAREAAKRFKEQQKMKSISDARQAVKDWTSYVETLKSVHKNCTDGADWQKIRLMPIPVEPVQQNRYEHVANFKRQSFKPGFFDKLFGLTQKKIFRLEQDILKAKAMDKKEFEKATEKYVEEFNEWTELQDMAEGIADQEPEYYKRALQYFNPFDDIGELGSQVTISFDKNFIDVEIAVNGEEVIPGYELSQTSTGKLSQKNMPKSRFYELYQDHICSTVLRIGREVFSHLPIEYVRVSAMSELLDTGTGHLEVKPILSVIIPAATLQTINLQVIDPSDSMRNFLHTMDFKKTTGFFEVEKVDFKP